MNSPNLNQTTICEIVEINWTDRWFVYKRLQELDISCWCAINQPLQVQINTLQDAIQLFSVVRQFTRPRQVLIDSLESCWHSSPTH